MKTTNNKTNQFEVPPQFLRASIFFMVCGLAAFVYALRFYPERAWANILINNYYFIGLALSGGFIIALQYVVNASWISPFKRIPEAFTAFLPAGFILMGLMMIGAHSLYEWTHEEVVAQDHILASKAAYLNLKFFIVRFCIFFTTWILTTRSLISLSRQQDLKGASSSSLRSQTKAAAIFLVTFAFSFSLASFDWIMSVDPHWFSTIFAVYGFSGMFLNGLVMITLSLIILQDLGYFKDVINENHYHDLGKMIFGFSTFWAYIWFCQYMLIWYANIPEETIYYLDRTEGNWDWPFFVNLIINWVVPFLALMTREAKRSRWVLTRVCILLLVGHWFDLYTLVAPKVFSHAKVEHSIGPVEVLMALGFAGLFVFIFMFNLKKANLLALHDPNLEEGLHLHQ